MYAIVEEAFVTQTLLNPNYLHLNLGLLKPAYILGSWCLCRRGRGDDCRGVTLVEARGLVLEAWSGMHRLALAGGAALVYAWHSFVQVPVVGNKSLMVARVGNAVFAAGLLLLLWIAAWSSAVDL